MEGGGEGGACVVLRGNHLGCVVAWCAMVRVTCVTCAGVTCATMTRRGGGWGGGSSGVPPHVS